MLFYSSSSLESSGAISSVYTVILCDDPSRARGLAPFSGRGATELTQEVRASGALVRGSGRSGGPEGPSEVAHTASRSHGKWPCCAGASYWCRARPYNSLLHPRKALRMSTGIPGGTWARSRYARYGAERARSGPRRDSTSVM